MVGALRSERYGRSGMGRYLIGMKRVLLGSVRMALSRQRTETYRMLYLERGGFLFDVQRNSRSSVRAGCECA